MKQRDFEGKDLEEALHTAAASLGIDEPDLDYEIIEQGRRGLFGLGSRNVRIRIMPPVEHPGEPQPGEPQPGESLPVRRPPAGPAERQEPRSGRRRRRGGRDAGRKSAPAKAGPPSSEDARSVATTLQKMLDLMGLELTVEAAPENSHLQLVLQGADAKVMTQKDGELLSALQFLLNRMARRTWPDVGRIQLSCDGQRKGRDDDLVELTREVSQQVSRTGQAKRLHPMNAYERRLVHMTAKEFKGVGSRSEGNGAMKTVRIFKQKKGSRPAGP